MPSADARDGTKRVQAIQASRAGWSRAISRRIARPPLVTAATMMPAIQTAGSCLQSERSEEKMSEAVLKRASLVPICDQTRVGQIRAATATPPRTALSGDARLATNSPAATAYHHQ